LINVTTGEAEETYKFESDASRVFAIEEAVASEFGNHLLARFGAKRSSEFAKRGTENEEAYRLYLRGTYFSDKRDAEPLHKALESFARAVELDPNYALAWAGKALAHRALTMNFRRDDTREQQQLAMEAVNKALALDPELSSGYTALCQSKFLYEWDFAGAEPVCKRAIELDASSSLAHQTYARFLTGRGRLDEAMSEIKIAIDLEPASLYSQQTYGVQLMLARRYDEAIEQFKRAIEMDENHNRNHELLCMTLALSGNEAEAFRVYMRAPERKNADDETVREFETAFRTSGWWRGVMRERAERFEDADRIYYVAGLWYGLAGDKDKAFEYLEKAYQRREWAMGWLKVDPRLDPLRDDPRFQDLLDRVEPK